MSNHWNPTRTGNTRSAAILGTVVAVIAVAGVAVAHRGAGTDTAPAVSRPLAVETLPARLESSYLVQRYYSGRVEPRRHSRVGFEQPGAVIEILTDEGDTVSQGQLLARIDTQRLRAERGELEAESTRTRADLALARITFERLTGLVKEGAASQQAVDDAREGLRALEAAEQLASARLQTNAVWLSKAKLLAPFDAVIVRRLIDEGRVINAGEPLLELQEITAPEARVGVAGHTASQFSPGERHTLEVNGSELPAVVKAVLPLRDSRQRTVDLIFALEVDSAQVRPGDLVTVAVEDTITESGYWVPISALTEGVRGLWAVFVAVPLESSERAATETHKVDVRAVELLHVRSEAAFVRGTLVQGDLVIAGGLHRIVTGQAIKLAGKS